jgi:hypothetical protein
MILDDIKAHLTAFIQQAQQLLLMIEEAEQHPQEQAIRDALAALQRIKPPEEIQ